MYCYFTPIDVLEIMYTFGIYLLRGIFIGGT